MRMCDGLGGAANDDALKIGQIVQVLGEALVTLRIEESDLGARILQRIFELRPGPPRIEGCRDRTDEDRAVESRRPFRQIAHGDRNAIAFCYAFLQQPVRDRKRGARKTFECGAVVLVNEERSCRKSGAAV